MTSQGSLRHQFQRALERGAVLDAVSAAKAMGGLSLGDALALCVVLADRDPARYRRAAARWLSRFVDEVSDGSLEETQLVAAALAALPTVPTLALPVLRELAATTYLVPPISVLVSWLLLGESPPALAFLGGALALAGVAVVRRG